MKKYFWTLAIMAIFAIGFAASDDESSKSQKAEQLTATPNEVENVERIDTKLIKDAYNSILDKCSSDEWNNLGTYFLYDITGDDIPELWVYAEDGTDSNFHIYTFRDKQAICIYKNSFEPSRTSFGYDKSKIYVKTGGMGHEEWNLFIYDNGKIENKEVYSWSQNIVDYEEVEESGVEPKCEEIKTYKIKDRTQLDKIGNGSTLIEVKKDNGTSNNADGSSFKQYSDYVGTWELYKTVNSGRIRMEVKLKENYSGEFAGFKVNEGYDEVLIYEVYPQCVFIDGIIYLTKDGDITKGNVAKFRARPDGLYSFDNQKYVRVYD